MTPVLRLTFLACAALLTLSAASVWVPRDVAQATGVVRVPLRFHVVERQGRAVADDAFLTSQLDHAKQVYAELGIDFVVSDGTRLPATHAELVSRADRDVLAQYLAPGVINCMVVASLMDVDEPGRERRGVHWTPRTARGKHFVIVSAISGPYVLAHELGHFLGNRDHSETPGNIMSYQLTAEQPFFDVSQKARVHETLAKLFATQELAGRER